MTAAQQLGRDIEERVHRAVVLPRTIPKKIDGTVLWPRTIASKEMSRHCARAQSRSRKCSAGVPVHTGCSLKWIGIVQCDSSFTFSPGAAMGEDGPKTISCKV